MSDDNRDTLIAMLSRPRLEVIPMRSLEAQIPYLPAGGTVSITCSPTRGLEPTFEHARWLVDAGFRVVPHISARLVRDEAELRDILRRLAALRLREIFVIGGDAKQAVGQFSSAVDLLPALVKIASDIDSIGVAAYPERHPFADDDTMRRALQAKSQFAGYMVTQICFDPRRIVGWLTSMRQSGVHLPVYIGLPGALDAKQLLRVSMKIGVGDSVRFLSKRAGLATSLIKVGGYTPDDLIDGLAPHLDDPELNIAGFHFNTFNQVENTERWRRRMLGRLTAGEPTERQQAI